MGKVLCLMLVEGPYDRQRLSVLSNLFNEDKLVLIPFGTDVLTGKDYYLDYENKIKELLNKEKTNEFSDFGEIVQVCDTDGCFVDDSFIIEDKSLKHIVYEANKIKAIDFKSLEGKRINKRKNIEELLSSSTIKIYYNTTNIDHAFDGIQNPTDAQKRTQAILMYNRYKNDGVAFIKRLIGLCPSLNGFEESWDFIKIGFNSLGQYTNLAYFVVDHFDCLKDEFKKLVSSTFTVAK